MHWSKTKNPEITDEKSLIQAALTINLLTQGDKLAYWGISVFSDTWKWLLLQGAVDRKKILSFRHNPLSEFAPPHYHKEIDEETGRKLTVKDQWDIVQSLTSYYPALYTLSRNPVRLEGQLTEATIKHDLYFQPEIRERKEPWDHIADSSTDPHASKTRKHLLGNAPFGAGIFELLRLQMRTHLSEIQAQSERKAMSSIYIPPNHRDAIIVIARTSRQVAFQELVRRWENNHPGERFT